MLVSGEIRMSWTKPDFKEINLSGEVTAYVNTDSEVRPREDDFARTEPIVVAEKTQAASV
jgi:coenzyme PQQ precursor peptide PqqA